MQKLFKLVKINLITYFNFYKILNAKTFNEKIRESIKFIFIILIYSIFAVYIYMFAKLSITSFIALNVEYVLLGMFFALSSIFTLFTTIFKVDGILFNNKDYDMLISMPIKKTTIIGSKIINLYLSNLVFTLIIMVPVLLVYTKYVAVSGLFYLLYIVSLFVIPFIPSIIAVIIGSLVTAITSRFKLKKLVQSIFMIALLVGCMFISFKSNSMNEMDIADIGNSLVNIFNKTYPLTQVYLNMLMDYNIKSILIFFIVPLLIFVGANYLISIIYSNVVSKINEKSTKRKYKAIKVNSVSPLRALVKKEFKRYLSSPNYIFNSSTGVFLLLIGAFALLFVSADKIGSILGVADLSNMLVTKGPFAIGFVLALSCTTSSSISLEGKSFWIIKSLPVDTSKIFMAKIILNLGIIVIPGILASLIIVYVFKLNIISLVLFILTIILYALFISVLGLIVNLHFPLLVWKNEIKVIKQSAASFVTIMTGMIVGMIPLLITPKINSSLYIVLVDLIILVIIGLMLFYLNTVGKKQFQALN